MNIEDDADILVGYIATALDNKAWDKARAKIVEYLHKYKNLNSVKLEQAQAKIDSLMLEYCPDEMTEDQKENWGKHQIPYKDNKLIFSGEGSKLFWEKIKGIRISA